MTLTVSAALDGRHLSKQNRRKQPAFFSLALSRLRTHVLFSVDPYRRLTHAWHPRYAISGNRPKAWSQAKSVKEEARDIIHFPYEGVRLSLEECSLRAHCVKSVGFLLKLFVCM